MEWLWLLAIGAGVYVGFLLGAKSTAAQANAVLQQRNSTQAVDRSNYLRVLRRELANHLMQRDPAAFAKLYERLHLDIQRYEGFSREALLGEFTALAERYPFYADFDLLGTRPHIVYPDAFGPFEDEDVQDHFRAIVRFHALNTHLDPDWSSMRVTSDEDVKHAREYAQFVLDAKFLDRLKAAKELYHAARTDHESAFESQHISVSRVRHIAEVRFGVHFKDTGEYGLFSTFYADGMESYDSYYRSDFLFEAEERLALLPTVAYRSGGERVSSL